MLDVDRLAETMLAGTRALIEKATAPLIAENAEIAARAERAEARLAEIEGREAVDVEAAVSAAVTVLRADLDVMRAALESAISERALKSEIPFAIEGKPGTGIASAKQNDDGELILKLTDGETLNVGKVRGADGLGFENMSVEHDGERGLTFTWSDGSRDETKRIHIPAQIYRGVWSEGSFETGDVVTWAGSLWIAVEDTDAKPDQGKGWKLAVKRGREGKPGAAAVSKPETVKR